MPSHLPPGPHGSTLLQKPYAFAPDESVTTNTNSPAVNFSGLVIHEHRRIGSLESG